MAASSLQLTIKFMKTLALPAGKKSNKLVTPGNSITACTFHPVLIILQLHFHQMAQVRATRVIE